MRAAAAALIAVWAGLLAAGAPARGADRETRIAARPTSVDSLIAVARAASGRDAHAAAIDAYELARSVAPAARRTEIESGLAFQYAWAGRLGEARAAFGRARAADPGDVDLALGEALVRNWMGDHLAAWRGYEALTRSEPERAAPWVGLAAAQNWAGRADLARASAARALVLSPDDRDAAAVRRAVRDGLAPAGAVYYDGSEDSDRYRANAVWAEVSVHVHPQLEIVPFARLQSIRSPALAAHDDRWAGVTAAARPATRLGLRARFEAPVSGTPGLPATGFAGADWTLSDRVRVGAGGERFAVVSARTDPERITGTGGGGWIELRPEWLTRVRVSTEVAHYDATGGFAANRRVGARLALSRQVWAPARLRAGLSAGYLDFRHDQDNGVWTPRDFRSGAATLEWNWGPRDRRTLSGELDLGPARERGGATVLYAVWRVGLFHAVGPVGVDLSVGHSEGNVETGRGYDRSYAHASIRRRF